MKKTKSNVTNNFLYSEYIIKNNSAKSIAKSLKIHPVAILEKLHNIFINGKNLVEHKKIKDVPSKEDLYLEYITNSKSITDIAGLCKVSNQKAKNILLGTIVDGENLINIRKVKNVKINKDTLFNKYLIERKPAKEIARELNVTEGTVYTWLQKYSIPVTRDFDYIQNHTNISRSYWKGKIRGADERNLEFNITIDDAWNAYLKQDGKCALSGIPILILKRSRKGSEQTASLDRINSKKGYTVNNIQWIHKDLNFLKSDFPENELFYWTKKMYEFNHLENFSWTPPNP